jgi:uncharacterized membrane protein
MTNTAKNWTPALLFLALALPLAGMRPLWLDEILQLLDTRQPSAAAVIALSRHDPGNVPLGYLVQHAVLKVIGYSVWRARLPAVLFGGAAIFLAGLLGRELGLRVGWKSAALLAVFPLTLRYGTEARVYSQALCFSLLATWIYVRLARKPDWSLAIAYWLALMACAYTQPYSVSVGLAHVLWAAAQRRRKAAWLGGAALTLAVAAFVPWYVQSKAMWTADLAGRYVIPASLRTPLMIFREFSGAGYWGSALLAVLFVLTAARRCLPRDMLTLLVLLIVAPIASAVASDAYFGYFLAARQFLWGLPAAAILAAAAMEHPSRTARTAAALLAIVCIWQNFRFFSDPHENWQAAADVLEDRVEHGDCLMVAPPEHAVLYKFFYPALQRAGCRGNRIVLAVTPYASIAQREAAMTTIASKGYRPERADTVGGSIVAQFRHCPE